MSNRRKIKDKGRIPGQWTALRWELLDSPAWKATSPGARLLYISLLRRLSYNALNNGKIFRSTREAAKEIGVAQRSVWMWFRELEHYGFIAMTSPGCIGPGGKAARWRITDMAWGVLDGKPVEATKDYLHWDGVLFDRPQKQKNDESNASGCSKKCVTPDAPNASAPLPSDAPNASEGEPIITAPNASNLVQPSDTLPEAA
jgi:hypothetical protein